MSDVVIFVATKDSSEGRESTIELNSDRCGTYLDNDVFATVHGYERFFTSNVVFFVRANRVRDGVVAEKIIYDAELSVGGVVEEVSDGVTVRVSHLAGVESI